jgi:hypothetical protein
MAPAAGHYGIFNGSKWRNQIAPVLEQWISFLRQIADQVVHRLIGPEMDAELDIMFEMFGRVADDLHRHPRAAPLSASRTRPVASIA